LVKGGKLVAVRDAGCATGTTIEVKSLFYNVPARRKFLRSDATETSHLDRAVETVALAFPAVGLHYQRDGRTVYRAASSPTLAGRVRDLFGAEERDALLDMAEAEAGGIRISGLVSRPGATRSDRARQFFFVNGRAVENVFLSTAVRDAYRQMLEPGRHPAVFVHLVMDPRAVDCNVHPAKREVRFRHGPAVRDALRASIEATLREARAAWLRPVQAHVTARLEPRSGADTSPAVIRTAHQPELPRPVLPAPALETSVPASKAVGTAEAASRAVPEEFRLVGALSRRYLLLEGPEGLVLLDQRAAHQRILFERLQRGVAGGAVASQRLLAPEVFELPARAHETVAGNLGVLASTGFGVEVFGGRSLKVEALPDFLAGRDPRRVLEDFAAACAETGPRVHGAGADDAVRRAVTRLAVDIEGARDEREQRALVTQLLACDLPYCDPEGRPVMLQFSWRDLDRKFGRT
jgi:DNA mismatch repair protein MutL